MATNLIPWEKLEVSIDIGNDHDIVVFLNLIPGVTSGGCVQIIWIDHAT